MFLPIRFAPGTGAKYFKKERFSSGESSRYDVLSGTVEFKRRDVIFGLKQGSGTWIY